MGWFKPNPMELKYGEPVHLMAIRALAGGAIRVKADIVYRVQYHFIGRHGVSYEGEDNWWRGEVHNEIAKLCENIQRDFNERIAGIEAARNHAIEKGSVAPLFVSAHTDEA